VLEGRCFSNPIVCFDAAGGAKELVERDCGFVMPYLDMDAMAEKVVVLLESPELRNEMGRRAANKTHERHDISVVAPRILRVNGQMLA
jgi:glycosyltransferase involved in cell wall biosynthesis